MLSYIQETDSTGGSAAGGRDRVLHSEPQLSRIYGSFAQQIPRLAMEPV